MSTLHYVVREPKITRKNPPLLILLHGYGSNESDLFSFANELPDELLIVSPRAPYTTVYGGHAWYAIDLDANNEKSSNLEEAQTSIDMLAVWIDEIKATYKTDSDTTFLLGFSQGAILSYALSFQYPNKVQHVLALSGYINEALLPKEGVPKTIATDYYTSHGTVDQVLPIALAKKSAVLLEDFELPYVFSEYPVGHGVAPQNFYSFKNWIEERL